MLSHIKNAFFYSVDGLKIAFKEEMAFKIITLQAMLIILLMMNLSFTYAQQAIILLSIALTFIVELLNSSIENIVDLATTDWHILAKKAKDMGSAAQFIASLSIYIQLFLIATSYN